MSPIPSIPTAADRQREVATIALATERVSARMLERVRDYKGATITMALDEYHEIGLLMCQSTTVARELHGLIAAGGPTRDEIIHINGSLAVALSELAAVAQATKAIGARIQVEPKGDEDAIDG